MYREILAKAIENSAEQVFATVQLEIERESSPLHSMIKEFDGSYNFASMISQSMLRGFSKLLNEEYFVMEASNQEVSDLVAHIVAQSSIDFLTGYKSSSKIQNSEESVEALKEIAKTSVGEEIFSCLRALTENFDEGSLQSRTPAEGPSLTKSSTFFGN